MKKQSNYYSVLLEDDDSVDEDIEKEDDTHCNNTNTNCDAVWHNVLREGDLLRMILGTYLSCDEWQTSILPVNKTWASVAMSLLKQNCVRIRFLDLENQWYDIFQSARHTTNFRKGRDFQNQVEYTSFMMAGAHLFDISIRRGLVGTLCNIYVDRNVVDILNLPRDLISRTRMPPGGCRKREKGYRFLQAACIQLSKLDVMDTRQPPRSTLPPIPTDIYNERTTASTTFRLNNDGNTAASTSNNDRAHIQRIGYELRNSPHHFPELRTISSWIIPLEKENKLCDVFRKALDEYYGQRRFSSFGSGSSDGSSFGSDSDDNADY